MTRPLFRLWARLNLVARLSLVAALSMTIVALSAAAVSSRYLARQAQEDIIDEYHRQMDTLESVAVSSLLVDRQAGHQFDLERLTGALSAYKYGPEVTRVSFRDLSDESAFSLDRRVELDAPLFFSRWCGLDVVNFSRPIVADGVYFGLLSLSMSPNHIINDAWRRYQYLVAVLVISLAAILFSTWLVSRRALRPLLSLATASKALTDGNLSTRVALAGSPEVRTVLSYFNQTASSFQSTVAALRASTSRSQIVLQTAMDGFWIVDSAGRLVEVNDAYCAMIGYGRDELLQMTIPQLEAIHSPEEVAVRLRRIGAGEPANFETVHRRKDGSLLNVDISVQRLAGSEANEVVAFLRDTTERRRAEEDRQQLMDQLIQAKKMEAVGRLAGGVAHDFNNMLGVIIGNAELGLDQVAPSEPLHESLQEILSAARRSADLTRKLLAFARKQTVAPRVLDMNETVASMIKMLQRLIGEDIGLVWRPFSHIWPVKMDPSQIDQILANLCVNARDAIDGVGTVTIETGNSVIDAAYCAAHPDAVPGEYAMLAVSDTGRGMDEDTLAHIFEPFFTTKSIGEGTGLGLATVFGAVKQNDGFINVSSKLGGGTRLEVFLPRHASQDSKAHAESVAEPLRRGHETILLVEDEPAILKITSKALDRAGYTVLAASSPGEAIGLARRHTGEIHLLMTDVVMPEMNGRDLVDTLMPLCPTAKRLFTSGYTADVIAHQGVLDEGVHFIQKPFSMLDLTAKVRSVLDRA